MILQYPLWEFILYQADVVTAKHALEPLLEN